MMMHETNTFSAVKTTLKDFDPRYNQELVRAYKGTRSGIGGFIDVLERNGAAIIPTIGAGATPSGLLRNKDYRTIVNTMIKVITETGNVDGVLLALHGAMIAEDAPDAEGTLLKKIREVAGPKVPIILTLDLHG
jgi:microcystin degradation protein MlrC